MHAAIKRPSVERSAVTQIGRPPVNTVSDPVDPFGGFKNKPPLRRPKKKINKAEIGQPENFRWGEAKCSQRKLHKKWLTPT